MLEYQADKRLIWRNPATSGKNLKWKARMTLPQLTQSQRVHLKFLALCLHVLLRPLINSIRGDQTGEGEAFKLLKGLDTNPVVIEIECCTPKSNHISRQPVEIGKQLDLEAT